MDDINDFGRTSFVRHTTGLIERLEKCTMNEQQEKILAVLDMSFDEQWKWLEKKYGGGAFHSFDTLVFMLRDQVVMPLVRDDENKWYKAVRIVVNKVLVDTTECNIYESLGWLATFGQPIHWIIAALLAKEFK